MAQQGLDPRAGEHLAAAGLTAAADKVAEKAARVPQQGGRRLPARTAGVQQYQQVGTGGELAHPVLHQLGGEKERERALRGLPGQLQRQAYGLGGCAAVEKIGVNAQCPPLVQQAEAVRAGGGGGALQLQGDTPGDIKVFPGLRIPNLPGAQGPALPADVDAEGPQIFAVGVPYRVLHQVIIGAAAVFQHPLDYADIALLKRALGEGLAHIHQLAQAALGVLRNVPDRMVHNGVQNGSGDCFALQLERLPLRAA